MRSSILAFAVVAAAACAQPDQTGSANGDVMRIPNDARFIPSGVMLNGHIDIGLGVGTSRVGDRFTARLDQPVVAGTGRILLPINTQLIGHVTGLVAPTATSPGVITLQFSEIDYFGRVRPLVADIVEVKPSRVPDAKTVTTDKPIGTILTEGPDGATAISLGGPESNGELPQASMFWLRLKQGFIP